MTMFLILCSWVVSHKYLHYRGIYNLSMYTSNSITWFDNPLNYILYKWKVHRIDFKYNITHSVMQGFSLPIPNSHTLILLPIQFLWSNEFTPSASDTDTLILISIHYVCVNLEIMKLIVGKYILKVWHFFHDHAQIHLHLNLVNIDNLYKYPHELRNLYYIIFNLYYVWDTMVDYQSKSLMCVYRMLHAYYFFRIFII